MKYRVFVSSDSKFEFIGLQIGKKFSATGTQIYLNISISEDFKSTANTHVFNI